MRILARGARFTRVPWVLVASTSVSLTTTIRAGVREVRVIGSLLSRTDSSKRPARRRIRHW
ncbi:MAG: hypothetical protein WCE47_15035 [Gaiella sp.]|uniref:hypothetical protein n=1 Tax=Gaiella sp. TaxID=2663207 RepID=UPI003C74F7F0